MIPKIITAGDYIEWDINPPAGYDLNKWQITYAIRGEVDLNVVGNLESGLIKFVIDCDTSSLFMPGTYYYQSYIDLIDLTQKSRRKTLIQNANFVVISNYIDADNDMIDGRSNAQKMLDKIELLIAKRLEQDAITQMTAKDRMIQKESLDRLISLRDYYRRELIDEKRKNGEIVGNTHRRLYMFR